MEDIGNKFYLILKGNVLVLIPMLGVYLSRRDLKLSQIVVKFKDGE